MIEENNYSQSGHSHNQNESSITNDTSQVTSSVRDSTPPQGIPGMNTQHNMPAPVANGLGANDIDFSKNTDDGNLIKKLLARSRAYTPEYAVLLIVTLSIVCLVNALFGSSIDYIGDPKPISYWGGGWQYTYSLSILAATIALLPAMMIFTKRIKGTEAEDNNVKNLGWRKGLLGVFLVAVTVTALGYAIALVYQIVSQIAGAGLVESSKSIWKTYLKDIFGVILFGSTALLYAKDYRFNEDEDDDKLHKIFSKVHRYGLAILAVILAVIFNFTAISAQRNDFIDNLISKDIKEINNKIARYESSKGKQVSSFDDIDLSDEIKSRAKKYNYEYEKNTSGYKLCAVFKTDTRDKDSGGSDTGLERALSGGSSYYDATANPSIHDKGKQCFDYNSSIRRQRTYNNNNYEDSSSYD